LAVNQVGALVPVSAWTFGDPADKFQHGLHLDPKNITFAPLGKLRHPINVKLPNGQFRRAGLTLPNNQVTEMCLRDCPGTLGYSRDSRFDAKNFLSTDYAHWGGSTLADEALQDDWERRQKEEARKGVPKQMFERQAGKSPPNSHVLCSMLLGFRLLHYLGCPRIYLMGVDLWMTDEKPYAFDQTKKARNGRYSDENAMLHEIKPVLEASGCQVFNTNPTSKCDAFPYVRFEEALEDCRGAVPEEPLDTALWYDKSFAEQNIKDNQEPFPVNELARLQRQARKKP
jgi:hypothetical protein